jgi:hypothetical protein
MPFDKYVKRPALPLCYLGEHPGNRDGLLTFVDAISGTAQDQVSGRAIFNLFSTFASWVARLMVQASRPGLLRRLPQPKR